MTEHPQDSIFGEDTGDAVWTYQGYKLGPSQFTTAMVHLYRAQVQRANVWRNRLDTTTNWSVVTVAAALTFSFSETDNPHFIILLVLILLLAFLNIEARRYRYYELWYRRVRLLETNFFAPMMSPPYSPSPDWGERLETELLDPSLHITWFEAVGHRFRRNYLWLITMLLLSWIIKLSIHPYLTQDMGLMIRRAAIGELLSGPSVTAITLGAYVLLILIGIVSKYPPEKRGIFKHINGRIRHIGRPQPKSQKALATIITDHGAALAQQLLSKLGRGVTAIEGQGMYTGESHNVLLCALTEVQIPHLEHIISETAPESFFIVSHAAQVRGLGFDRLETPS